MGNRNPFRAGVSQRSWSGLKPPSVTMQWTWMCCPRFCPQVCSDHGDAEFTAEPAGIATELEQGLGSGLEEQLVDEFGTRLSEGVEFVRQRENDMPVADVEQIGTLTLDPSGLRECLTLGAVPVPARSPRRVAY